MTKIVFFSHPFGGKEENIIKASGILRYLRWKYLDTIFLSPIHTFGWLVDSNPEHREYALNGCRELIKRCDELWLAPVWQDSPGCRQEKQWAEEFGVKVMEL